MVKAKANSTNVTPPSQMPPGELTALAGRLWSRADTVALRELSASTSRSAGRRLGKSTIYFGFTPRSARPRH
jgi:hypothetical protein